MGMQLGLTKHDVRHLQVVRPWAMACEWYIDACSGLDRAAFSGNEATGEGGVEAVASGKDVSVQGFASGQAPLNSPIMGVCAQPQVPRSNGWRANETYIGRLAPSRLQHHEPHIT